MKFRLIAIVAGIAILPPLGTVSGIDESVFVAAHGSFDNPTRTDARDIECLQYGTGDPATFSAVGTPDPAAQSTTPGETNQIRFGRIPEAFGGGCSNDPGAETGLGSSGFGFAGAASAALAGDGFELGRFTHFNRTIERGLRNADLTTVITFDALGGPVDMTVTLDIALDETSDFNGQTDTSLCQFDVAENATITTPIMATLCADQVTIAPIGPMTPAYGQTELLIEVSGIAPVVGGECDTANLVAGNSFYSAEQAATEICVIASLAGGSITVDKTVEGGPGAEFDFTLTEYDQRDTPASPGDSQTLQIDATSGSGSTGIIDVEAGLYLLEEVDPGSGYSVEPLTCTSDGVEATVELDGVTYVDIDSNENLVCSFVNVVVTTTTSTTTTSTTTIAPATTEPLSETTSTSAPDVTLPATGNSPANTALIASLLSLAGLAGIAISRRPLR